MRRFLLATLLAVIASHSIQAQGHSGSCTCGGFAVTPVMWEIEHTANAGYAAAAVDVFERWNRYASVFTYRSGDGVMAPNGTNEIGFLDRATTSARYGINLDRNTFAITFMSPLTAAGDFDACPKPANAKCGTFDETDVIMNADFARGFRPSGPVDYTDRAPALYGATAGHELGHALGFHHNVSNVSVMNLYEDFASRYIATSDTQELRTAYPARATRIVDLALYPFSFDPALTDDAATTPVETPPVAVRGGAVTIRNFSLENVGSENVNGIRIRFYLSVDSDVTADDFLLGFLEFPGPIAPGAFWDDAREGRSFIVPRELPFGVYQIVALISDSLGVRDSVEYNNVWIGSQPLAVVSGERRRTARH